jgi:cation diffusion facilitator family transporter
MTDQHISHDHNHDHVHQHNSGIIGWIKHQIKPHSHGHQEAALDAALATDRGMWALKVSFAGLMATAIFQVVIVAISSSVALLADTIHNFSDALTAIPLGLAFWLSRRARNTRYTYGYGRAEDIAGVIIVMMIAYSAFEAIRHAIERIINPEPISNLGWVAAAAIIGFFGNEIVAVFRIRIGKQIGSAALVADGYHARTDGFTSLAVLAGAIGVWIGYPLLDPIIGILIGIAIMVIVFNTARDMWYRIMDAVDPSITERVESSAAVVDGVLEVHATAVRWVGHRLRAELHIVVDCQISTLASHNMAESVRHTIFHEFPAMVEVTVHVDPCECNPDEDYHPTEHHVD